MYNRINTHVTTTIMEVPKNDTYSCSFSSAMRWIRFCQTELSSIWRSVFRTSPVYGIGADEIASTK